MHFQQLVSSAIFEILSSFLETDAVSPKSCKMSNIKWYKAVYLYSFALSYVNYLDCLQSNKKYKIIILNTFRFLKNKMTSVPKVSTGFLFCSVLILYCVCMDHLTFSIILFSLIWKKPHIMRCCMLSAVVGVSYMVNHREKNHKTWDLSQHIESSIPIHLLVNTLSRCAFWISIKL